MIDDVPDVIDTSNDGRLRPHRDSRRYRRRDDRVRMLVASLFADARLRNKGTRR